MEHPRSDCEPRQSRVLSQSASRRVRQPERKGGIAPILGITDPKTDPRIDFIGGIRGIGELERRVDSGEFAVAFSLYPTSIDQLLNVADAEMVMPPKSTWFEPKLRSGMVVNLIKN